MRDGDISFDNLTLIGAISLAMCLEITPTPMNQPSVIGNDTHCEMRSEEQSIEGRSIEVGYTLPRRYDMPASIQPNQRS